MDQYQKSIADSFVPKAVTKGGKMVLNNRFKSLKEYYDAGYSIDQPWIFDKLVTNYTTHEVSRSRTNKMTAAGVQMRFKYAYLVGDGMSIVGLGFGKNRDKRLARLKAIDDAKKNAIIVNHGCGSRKCDKNCNRPHSIIRTSIGRCASTVVEITPAPYGKGRIAAGSNLKLYELAGIKDIWTRAIFTGHRVNAIKAHFDALKKLNN